MTKEIRLLHRVRDVRKRMKDAAVASAMEAAVRHQSAEERLAAAEGEKEEILESIEERFVGSLNANGLELFDHERKFAEHAVVDARRVESDRHKEAIAADDHARRRARELKTTEKVLDRRVSEWNDVEMKIEQRRNDDLVSSVRHVRNPHDSGE